MWLQNDCIYNALLEALASRETIQEIEDGLGSEI